MIEHNLKPVYVFLIFLFLFVLSIVNANALAETTECSDLFRDPISNEINFDSLFPSVKNDYPILSRIITNKFYRRSEKIKNDSNWNQLEDLIANCSSSACKILLNSDAFSVRGSVQIINKSGKNILNLRIDRFIATNAKFVGKKKKLVLRYPDQMQGTNMQFRNLMSILFSSIYVASQNNPDISAIRITGISVINDNLAKILMDLGFKTHLRVPKFISRRNILAPRNWVLELPLN